MRLRYGNETTSRGRDYVTGMILGVCVCVALPEPLYLLLAAGLLLLPVQPPQVVCRLAVARTALPPEDILTVDTGYYKGLVSHYELQVPRLKGK